MPAEGVRVNRTGRRTYSAQYKRRLVEQCTEGVSVAGIALANGLNANLLRRWIVRHRGAKTAPTLPRLLPVSIEAPAAAERSITPPAARNSGRGTTGAIEIEVYGARIHLRGAVDAASLALVLEALSRQ
jgi:transposase-like protein